MLLAVLNYLREDLAGNVRKRDAIIGAIIFYHVFYGLRFERHRLVHLEGLPIGALQGDFPRRHGLMATKKIPETQKGDLIMVFQMQTRLLKSTSDGPVRPKSKSDCSSIFIGYIGNAWLQAESLSYIQF